MLDLSSSSSCSSSWIRTHPPFPASFRGRAGLSRREDPFQLVVLVLDFVLPATDREIRSEERRVGKSVDLGGRRIIKKTKKTHIVTKWNVRTRKNKISPRIITTKKR